MINQFIDSFSSSDLFALGWFVICWAGYGIYSEKRRGQGTTLLAVSHRYRQAWAESMLTRDLRMTDAALIGNMMSTVTFYANTTIYILAGLFALLGTLDKVMSIAGEMPFATHAAPLVVEAKLLLLLTVFVIAYFKFTWSLRQFNLLTILVGAAPSSQDGNLKNYADKLAKTNTLAGDEFNRGIRAYYFGIAAVTWMIQPLLFAGVTTVILVVLYRRDFSSSILDALNTPDQ